VKGVTEERPYQGLQNWKPIVEDCSNCMGLGGTLFQACFIYQPVLKKLHEAAVGAPTKFCYCVECDEVICRNMPPAVSQFTSDRHQAQHDCSSAVVDNHRDLEAALEQFRGVLQ